MYIFYQWLKPNYFALGLRRKLGSLRKKVYAKKLVYIFYFIQFIFFLKKHLSLGEEGEEEEGVPRNEQVFIVAK